MLTLSVACKALVTQTRTVNIRQDLLLLGAGYGLHCASPRSATEQQAEWARRVGCKYGGTRLVPRCSWSRLHLSQLACCSRAAYFCCPVAIDMLEIIAETQRCGVAHNTGLAHQ